MVQRNLRCKETSMSLRNVPSEDEVMRWNPQSLADYMRKLKLSSCDEVVLKSNITGAQFMKMTHCELEVFPGLHVPSLTSIQIEITSVQRKDLSKTQNHFESPYQNDEDEDYICALAELQTAEEKHTDKTSKCKYELANFAHPKKPPKQARDAAVLDCRGALYSDLKVVKIKKPELPVASPRSKTKSKGSIVSPPRSPSMRPPQPQAPKPPCTSHRMYTGTPAPLMAAKPCQEKKLIPGPKQMTTQLSATLMGTTHNVDVDLDPSWYGGKVTRSAAEMALREVNKDGAFLVRDSSRSFTDHCYTLMILNKGKVYNIKISHQSNSYVLGSSLRNMQSFPGVREMINHYTHTPLLLIDGRDQTSEEQCRLMHPVGL